MDREIKFRAWDKVNKRMGHFESGFSWHDEYDLWYIQQVTTEYNKQITVVPCRDNIAMMQFTGFKDLNNKDAYFGDICHLTKGYGENGGLYKMEQDKYGEPYFISITTDRPDIFRIRLSEYFERHLIGNFEIVGNIYENPELINP